MTMHHVSVKKLLEINKILHVAHKTRAEIISYGIVVSFIEYHCVNMSNSNSLFTHCLRSYTKKAATNFVTASFLAWTSLGLNQGPPDYESVALTN